MASDGSNDAESSIRKHTGLLKYLTCYEITEDELDQIAKGPPTSGFKDFGIAASSIGLSFLGTLFGLTCDASTCPGLYAAVVSLAGSGITLGAILLAVWFWHRDSLAPVFKKIRSRLIEAPVTQPAGQGSREGSTMG